MKPFFSILLIALTSCSAPQAERLFIENLSRQLSENNASFTLNVQPGSVIIHRSNPTIGMSGSAGPNGVTTTSLTNLQMAIQYVVATQSPTTPGLQSTNILPKTQTK